MNSLATFTDVKLFEKINENTVFSNTLGIQLPAIQLPEISSYRTFSSLLTEWSNNP